MNISKTTQELRVLKALQDASGDGWVNGQYFLRELFLSQYHRAIWNLQHRRDKYNYEGTVEASTFTDEHGFKSYRISPTCRVLARKDYSRNNLLIPPPRN